MCCVHLPGEGPSSWGLDEAGRKTNEGIDAALKHNSHFFIEQFAQLRVAVAVAVLSLMSVRVCITAFCLAVANFAMTKAAILTATKFILPGSPTI